MHKSFSNQYCGVPLFVNVLYTLFGEQSLLIDAMSRAPFMHPLYSDLQLEEHHYFSQFWCLSFWTTCDYSNKKLSLKFINLLTAMTFTPDILRIWLNWIKSGIKKTPKHPPKVADRIQEPWLEFTPAKWGSTCDWLFPTELLDFMDVFNNTKDNDFFGGISFSTLRLVILEDRIIFSDQLM